MYNGQVAKKHLDISVIIPFKDKSEMTAECVDSLFKYGPHVKEILLVSNNSEETELENLRNRLTRYPNAKIIEYNHPFNYQIVNNWAAAQATGKFILFLNNDTELVPESRGLIEYMFDKASEPKTGIVGCLLLYGDKKHIQHAGVFLVSGGLAEHMYVGETYDKIMKHGGSSDEYPYDIKQDIPMTAVTAAIHLVEKKKFDEINGFDERFILCGGDVDLCIRMNKAGYQTLFVSDNGKFILHKESQSRQFKPVPFIDFYYSYLSYSTAYDTETGDPFLPKICELKEVK